MAFVTNLTSTLVYNSFVMGYPSGVDNDQGNIRAGGTIAETDKWTSSALGDTIEIILISSGVNNTGVIPPSTASTFNNQPGEVIVKYTTDIAGVSDLTQAIRSAGSSGIYSINQLDVMRSINYKTSVIAGNWNIFSGAFSPALSVTEAGGWSIADGVDQSSDLRGSGTDVAANPTQLIPGKLRFYIGSGAEAANYSAKTNW